MISSMIVRTENTKRNIKLFFRNLIHFSTNRFHIFHVHVLTFNKQLLIDVENLRFAIL